MTIKIKVVNLLVVVAIVGALFFGVAFDRFAQTYGPDAPLEDWVGAEFAPTAYVLYELFWLFVDYDGPPNQQQYPPVPAPPAPPMFADTVGF